MWVEPVSIFGFKFTPYQLLVLTAFAGLIVGYFLAVWANRRSQSVPGSSVTEDKERATSNVAFMKGINYILTDNPDQAIEEFTRAVAVDTETVETYVALGNLFRGQGEIDRAIRIRQSIMLRPNIGEKVRLQARYDLGLDYRRGGFYERALKTFQEVLAADPKHGGAFRQMVLLYEETRDWENAFAQLEKLARLTGEKFLNVLAHYQVEIGKEAFDKGLPGPAKAAYKKALSLHAGCVDAYLHWGDLQMSQGKHRKALGTWRKIIEVAPEMTYLIFGRLALAASRMRDLGPVESVLADCAAAGPNALAHLTLARLLAQKGDTERAIRELRQALRIDPRLLEARREIGLLLLALGRDAEALEAYKDFLQHLMVPEATFQCGQCGFESKDLMWRCPQCFSWDTMALHRHRPVLFSQEVPETKALVVAGPAKEASSAESA
jgi:lipopolysaccharide biosynthesis regulator YciM